MAKRTPHQLVPVNESALRRIVPGGRLGSTSRCGLWRVQRRGTRAVRRHVGLLGCGEWIAARSARNEGQRRVRSLPDRASCRCRFLCDPPTRRSTVRQHRQHAPGRRTGRTRRLRSGSHLAPQGRRSATGTVSDLQKLLARRTDVRRAVPPETLRYLVHMSDGRRQRFESPMQMSCGHRAGPT